jgi:sulfonate transport system ATP-binding protein
VRQNVSLGLELRRLPRPAIDQKVEEFLDLVGLGQFSSAYPGQLSGGMAQRVGIARALATNPEILLLDEPLGALDAMTKMRMQRKLERIWQAYGVTMIMVTHDIEEAVYLADRIVVLSGGPNNVRRVIPVPLPRPKDRSSKQFGEIREALFQEFHLCAAKTLIGSNLLVCNQPSILAPTNNNVAASSGRRILSGTRAAKWLPR